MAFAWRVHTSDEATDIFPQLVQEVEETSGVRQCQKPADIFADLRLRAVAAAVADEIITDHTEYQENSDVATEMS